MPAVIGFRQPCSGPEDTQPGGMNGANLTPNDPNGMANARPAVRLSSCHTRPSPRPSWGRVTCDGSIHSPPPPTDTAGKSRDSSLAGRSSLGAVLANERQANSCREPREKLARLAVAVQKQTTRLPAPTFTSESCAPATPVVTGIASPQPFASHAPSWHRRERAPQNRRGLNDTTLVTPAGVLAFPGGILEKRATKLLEPSFGSVALSESLGAPCVRRS